MRKSIDALPARRLGVRAHGVEIAAGARVSEDSSERRSATASIVQNRLGRPVGAASEILDLGGEAADRHAAGQQEREAAIDLQPRQRDDEGGNAKPADRHRVDRSRPAMPAEQREQRRRARDQGHVRTSVRKRRRKRRPPIRPRDRYRR